METIIKLKSSELTDKIFKKIKELTEDNDLVEIKVYTEKGPKIYSQKLDTSLQELKEEKTIVFTAEEFAEYIKPKK